MMRLITGVFAVCALALGGNAWADPKSDVHEAFAKFLDAKSFRATVTDVKKGQQLSEMEFVAPDRYHMKTGNGPEMFIVGDTGYMKVEGRMMKVPINVGNIIAQYRNKQMSGENEKNITVTDVGSDVIDGVPTHAYTYAMSEPDKAQGKLWISDKTGYPLQMESEGTFMRVKTTTRVRYSDFNDTSIAVATPN